MRILILKWLRGIDMRLKIEKNLGEPKNKTLKRLSNLTEKIRPRKNFASLIGDNTFFTMELNHTQEYSKARIRAELAGKQCNGLIYSNLVKFR